MGANQALENLLSAKPENILQQLYFFNSKIQISNKNEVIAIWYTLESGKQMVKPGENAYMQLNNLQRSCRSRMQVLLSEISVTSVSEKERLHKAFKEIVGEL